MGKKALRVLAVMTVAVAPVIGVPAVASARAVDSSAQGSAPPSYAVLGDSYSAGLGAGGALISAGSDMSVNSFGAVWAKEAGFTSAGTLQPLPKVDAGIDAVREAQLPAMKNGTSIATITVGVDDLGLSRAARICMEKGNNGECIKTIEKELEKAKENDYLKKKLVDLYRGILEKISFQGELIAFDYPHFIEVDADINSPVLHVRDYFEEEERRAMRDAVSWLSKTIGEAVAATEVSHKKITYVSVLEAFRGHAVLSADSWLDPSTDKSMFHPTSTGQRSGYFAAFNSEVPAQGTATIETNVGSDNDTPVAPNAHIEASLHLRDNEVIFMPPVPAPLFREPSRAFLPMNYFQASYLDSVTIRTAHTSGKDLQLKNVEFKWVTGVESMVPLVFFGYFKFSCDFDPSSAWQKEGEEKRCNRYPTHEKATSI